MSVPTSDHHDSPASAGPCAQKKKKNAGACPGASGPLARGQEGPFERPLHKWSSPAGRSKPHGWAKKKKNELIESTSATCCETKTNLVFRTNLTNRNAAIWNLEKQKPQPASRRCMSVIPELKSVSVLLAQQHLELLDRSMLMMTLSRDNTRSVRVTQQSDKYNHTTNSDSH